jgi:hypothetical protein
MSEQEAPALPEDAGKETWRGQDSDGDWCAVTDDGARVWLMGDELTDGWQEFHDAEMHAHVCRTWALSLARRLADAEARRDRSDRALGAAIRDLDQARKDYDDACRAMVLRVDLQARIRELEADLAAEREHRRDVP